MERRTAAQSLRFGEEGTCRVQIVERHADGLEDGWCVRRLCVSLERSDEPVCDPLPGPMYRPRVADGPTHKNPDTSRMGSIRYRLVEPSVNVAAAGLP